MTLFRGSSPDGETAAKRLEVIGRWLEKMPGLRTQWGIYCSRRRYMLEMEAITEEMLQPGTALERLLVREVRTYPFDTKAAFVARVAFYLDSASVSH